MLLTVFSCQDNKEEDDQLSLTKTNYSGSELKIDGYYFTIFENRKDNFSFFMKMEFI